MRSLWQTVHRCQIESAEDIYDAQGVKLWASHQALAPELLDKLTGRQLRKPIELCVVAKDPVAVAALLESVEAVCAQWPHFDAALAPHRLAVHDALRALLPNPQELLMISVMRHGQSKLLAHTAAVTGLTLVLALVVGLDARSMRALAHAALLHDVGMLYWPSDLTGAAAERAYLQHPVLGARAAVELARSSHEIEQLVACSHERVDGSGFPRTLAGDQLTLAARVLEFAEAMVEPLTSLGQGAMRAAVAARIVPGEFEQKLVSWIALLARAVAAPQASPGDEAQWPAIGAALRQLHGDLARCMVLLSMPAGEVPEVRTAAAAWYKRLYPLMRALRSSGVEEALVQGQTPEPQSAGEAAELLALHQELVQRMAAFLQSLRLQLSQNDYLPDSPLTKHLFRILDPVAPEGMGPAAVAPSQPP